jgi:Bacterial mobilisation protein (MobC)
MNGHPLIAARVTPETKARLHALAQQHQVTDSVLLKRLVELALLQTTGVSEPRATDQVRQISRDARVYVRLRPEDHLLLRERAASRGMATATYVSMLVRAHLRAVSPLPDRELGELKRSVAELGAIGRNLNQIARMANQTGRLTGPSVQELHALLRACAALKDHVKTLIIANTASWETGHAEANR